jgi:hypothetical protein
MPFCWIISIVMGQLRVSSEELEEIDEVCMYEQQDQEADIMGKRLRFRLREENPRIWRLG